MASANSVRNCHRSLTVSGACRPFPPTLATRHELNDLRARDQQIKPKRACLLYLGDDLIRDHGVSDHIHTTTDQ